VPDLKDSSGRMTRIVIAVAVGVACSVAAYFITGAIVASRETAAAAHVSARQMSGGQFVLWVTFATFPIAVALALGILNNIAKKKWERQQLSNG
jgi:hypothetical protein